MSIATELSAIGANVATFFDSTLYPHTCDLWKPTDFTINADKSIQDLTYTLVTSGQKCWLESTSEDDEPRVQGRSKVVNIFTLDQFFFPDAVTVEDTYVIKFTSPGVNHNKFWVVEGNPQSFAPLAPAGFGDQMVYAKQSPTAPPGVT